MPSRRSVAWVMVPKKSSSGRPPDVVNEALVGALSQGSRDPIPGGPLAVALLFIESTSGGQDAGPAVTQR